MINKNYFNVIDSEIKAYYYGLFFNLSKVKYKKYIPKINKKDRLFPTNIPKDLIRHFVRGYVDANANIAGWSYGGIQGRSITIPGNENFLNSLGQILMDALAILPRISKNKTNLKVRCTDYIFKLFSWLYTKSSICDETLYNAIIVFKKYRESLGDTVYWNKIREEPFYLIRPSFTKPLESNYKPEISMDEIKDRRNHFYEGHQWMNKFKKYEGDYKSKAKPRLECKYIKYAKLEK